MVPTNIASENVIELNYVLWMCKLFPLVASGKVRKEYFLFVSNNFILGRTTFPLLLFVKE